MKILLFIPFLFVCSMVIGQTYNSTKIIGKPIKIGKLEIAQKDFPDKMIQDSAKKACENLGKGWRLPTESELKIMYKNKDKIGGFANYFYWGSSKYYFSGYTWYFGFANFEAAYDSFSKSRTAYVRAVRSF